MQFIRNISLWNLVWCPFVLISDQNSPDMKIILPLNHSAVLLFFLTIFVVNSVSAAPRIECENPKYDFGTVIGRDQITHEFIIWNRGDEPLEIMKIKNCCGVETKVEPMTIPPGSNAVCTSVFTTKNRYGEQDKQILLITNDKKNLYFDLRMTGTLLKPIELSPRWIRLGDILSDTTILETITATNLLEQAVALESVSTTVNGLAVEIVENDCRAGMADSSVGVLSKEERLPAEGGQGAAVRSETVTALQKNMTPIRSWTIQVKSSGPLAVGPVNGQVQLHFSTGIVSVPVIGTVRPILQATPEQIKLSSGSSEEVERLVMLRSGDGRAFEILSATLDKADGKVEFNKRADGKWQIKLTVLPDSIKHDAVIIFKTSQEAQETITIPLVR